MKKTFYILFISLFIFSCGDNYEMIDETKRFNKSSGEVEILTDNYPQDLIWRLSDANNITIAEGNGIGIQPNDLISLNLDLDTSMCYTFTIIDDHGDGICCDFGDGYYDYDSVVYHSYSDTGTYDVTLVITTLFNCLDTLTKSVKITDYTIYIPNAFTPFSTDDELNDIFKAYGSGIEEFNMIIYDRWGQQIFISNSIDDGWDGRSMQNDNQVPAGIYMYTIDLVNIYGQDYKYQGQVKLIR